MLVELRIENLGIIEGLHTLVGPGLTAITGETGAGKTLVTGALALLAGERADAAMVRDGADEARVEGRFETANGAEVVLARVVPASGRSRADVDGRLATASELAARGIELLDLHAQHAHQMLVAPAAQRRILDSFAGAPAVEALAAYRRARAELARIDEELAALGGDTRTRAREIALLEFQVAEIDDAALSDPAEESKLEAEEALLADAVGLREALFEAHRVVDSSADELGTATAALADRTPVAPLEHRIRGLQAEALDVAQELRAARESIVDDPQRLDVIRTRRQRFRDLGRKYGADVAEILAYRADAAERLQAMRTHDERVAALESEQSAAVADRDAAAGMLRAARQPRSSRSRPRCPNNSRRWRCPERGSAPRSAPVSPSTTGRTR